MTACGHISKVMLTGLAAIITMSPVLLSADRAGESGKAKIMPPPVGNVQVEDAFWAPRLKVYREKTIPHSWNYMGWEIRALKAANGLKVDGDLNNTWGEANLYKFMETCAYSLAMHPDEQLEKRIDEIIELLSGAQQPDGYLHAYVTNAGKTPWDPAFLDGSHDGYVLGHMIEAALEYDAATGKKTFLAIAQKAADQAYEHFLGPNGVPGFCGHAELEMALVELYRAVPNKRYLDLSRAFVEWRGRGKVKPFSETPRAYFQDEVPLRRQTALDGHAVRAVFFAAGVADIALETGDCDYRLAANRFWDSVTLRRMYITGSAGAREEHEAFGEDYELPNDGYCESCAACGMLDFAQRMFMLERTSQPIDVLERTLYNAVLHGISLDGTTTYYRNPLSDRDRPRDNCWVCCPPNLSRTLFQVGRYAYAFTNEDIYVNLFVGGSCTIPWKKDPVSLHVSTDYPWNGDIEIRVAAEAPRQFALHLRIPEWCRDAGIMLNGRQMTPLPLTDAGYVRIERPWKNHDTVKLTLPMPVMKMQAHPAVQSCAGKIALQRGPLVYGFEGIDNEGIDLHLAANSRFDTEHRPDMLGGVTVLRTRSKDGRDLTAIPFYALANRQNSTQEVWVRQEGARPDTRWWLAKLYRPIE
ncbi:MAG: glycoside hydrolase family 127 protein [Phycisphaerae bacterium]|nr:glycoside hydrolase family 127 protein [Phycisphaerae bacterium]